MFRLTCTIQSMFSLKLELIHCLRGESGRKFYQGFNPPPPTFLKSIETIKKREKRERHGLKHIYLFSFWMYTRL